MWYCGNTLTQFSSLPVYIKKSAPFSFEVISPMCMGQTGLPSKLSVCIWLPCVRGTAL